MEIHYRIKKQTFKIVSSDSDEPQIVERYYPMVNFFVPWYYLHWDGGSFTYTQNKQDALYRGTYKEALKAYFEASEKYNEVRERYIRCFEEAKARAKNTLVGE